jgi:hypothetical protein
MVNRDDEIYIIIGAVALLWLIILITTTVIVGKHKNWSRSKIFGMFVLGLFFPPIWLILLIVLEPDKPNTGSPYDDSKDFTFSDQQPYQGPDRHTASPPIDIPQGGETYNDRMRRRYEEQ